MTGSTPSSRTVADDVFRTRTERAAGQAVIVVVD
ncbi:hypothetical protein APS67_003827 [Streptomyces sp. AVP053U2]|nr:hypothetical protein APS67_003827 [Streptomyces sp. AVP053U2]